MVWEEIGEMKWRNFFRFNYHLGTSSKPRPLPMLNDPQNSLRCMEMLREFNKEYEMTQSDCEFIKRVKARLATVWSYPWQYNDSFSGVPAEITSSTGGNYVVCSMSDESRTVNAQLLTYAPSDIARLIAIIENNEKANSQNTSGN